MRHDSKYSQSHLSAVRQRPDGSIMLGQQQQYNMGYHRKHYHHDNEDYNNNNNYNRYNKERYFGSHSDTNSQNGERVSGGGGSSSSSSDNGGVVSALSVTHESEKQWEWLEEVLAKSTRNKETVSNSSKLFTFMKSSHAHLEFKIYSLILEWNPANIWYDAFNSWENFGNLMMRER